MNQFLARCKKKRALALRLSPVLSAMMVYMFNSFDGVFSAGNTLAATSKKIPSKPLEKVFPHSLKCKSSRKNKTKPSRAKMLYIGLSASCFSLNSNCCQENRGQL
jgi:hypothetical protein